MCLLSIEAWLEERAFFIFANTIEFLFIFSSASLFFNVLSGTIDVRLSVLRNFVAPFGDGRCGYDDIELRDYKLLSLTILG